MADRDDANLRHFKSRSQQPKLLCDPKKSTCGSNISPVTMSYVFDSGFGGAMDQSSSVKFRHIGTSPNFSSYEKSRANDKKYNTMKDAYYAK